MAFRTTQVSLETKKLVVIQMYNVIRGVLGRIRGNTYFNYVSMYLPIFDHLSTLRCQINKSNFL